MTSLTVLGIEFVSQVRISSVLKSYAISINSEVPNRCTER